MLAFWWKWFRRLCAGIICVCTVICVVIGISWWRSQDYTVYGVPVLNYHEVNDTVSSPLTVRVSEFRQQMEYLHTHGYHTITLAELYEYAENGEELPSKPVVITFDDGYTDNYENAFPIMQSYGMKGTLFMISDAVDTDRFLSLAQLREMKAGGFDIQGHTYHHTILTRTDPSKLSEELAGGKAVLEQVLQSSVEFLAYPGGFNNASVQSVTRTSGYKMAFTVQPGTVKRGDNLYALPRMPIFEGDHTFMAFWLRLHCAPYIEATWSFRDSLKDSGHYTLASLVPLL